MKFLLVSTENPNVKKEIEIPEEMVAVQKPKKPRISKAPIKPSKASTKPSKSIKGVQHTKSII